MRIFSFMLLLWCALLTAVPCCAFDGCEDDVQTEQSSHPDDEGNDCGACSPFFACHGCSGFVVGERVHIRSIEPAQPSVKYVVRKGEEREVGFAVMPWQPPRARV